MREVTEGIESRLSFIGNSLRGKVAGHSIAMSRRELAVVLTVYLLGAVLRIIYVLNSPSTPASDEYSFVHGAQAVLDFFRGGGSLQDAVGWLGIRGPLYPVYLAAIYGVFGNSGLVVKIIQALTDASTCVLIYWIGREVFSCRVGLLSAGLAIIYTPFILSTGMLLRETLASFLLALTVLLLTRALMASSPIVFLVSGFSLGLTVLCNPANMILPTWLLPIPALAGWKGFRRRHIAQNLGAMMIGLAVPIGSWMTLTGATIGQPLVSASGMGTAGTGGFLNFLDTDGWKHDGQRRTTAYDIEAKKVLQQHGYEFTDLTRTQRFELLDSLAVTYRLEVAVNIIRSSTIPVVVMIPIKNLYRLWSYPYNNYLHSFLLSYPQQVLLHRAVVYLALLGIPVSLVLEWKRSIVIVLVLAHLSLMWALVHIEVRHNSVLMPYMIVMAGGALWFLVSTAWNRKSSAYTKRALLCLGVSTGLCLVALLLPLGMLQLIWRDVSALYVHFLVTLLGSLLLLCLAFSLYFVARISLKARKAAFVAFFPVFVLLIGYSSNAVASMTWCEWRSRLSHSAQRIRQEIALPQDLEVGRFSEGALMIDMSGGINRAYDLVVELNGQRVKEYYQGLTVQEGKFDSYHEYYGSLLSHQDREPEDVRQWFEIPVDLSLFADTDRAVVDVYLMGDSVESDSYLDVYGDYATGNERVFEGPSFALERSEMSLYKYLYDHDFRVVSRTPLESPDSSSAFYDGSSWSYTDLSPEIGIQTGEFRIRLRLVAEDGVVMIL